MRLDSRLSAVFRIFMAEFPRSRWYTASGMTGTLRDQRVHGTRSARLALRCVLFAPDGSTPPEELTRSLAARDAELVVAPTTFEALAALLVHSNDRTTPVLLLLEPDQHADRCVELARAAQIFAPSARVWRHCANQTPSLAAYDFPSEITEAEQVAAVREELRSAETPYDKARRESAAPSLRLVMDEPDDVSVTAAVNHQDLDNRDSDDDPGLLTADELEMLMDPIYEPKPRRGGDPR